jgi:phenylacetate-coenzyme A ligase PaaK-like adenylate-forming protein
MEACRRQPRVDQELDVPAKVTLVEPRTIPRPEGGKTRRVVDKRQI